MKEEGINSRQQLRLKMAVLVMAIRDFTPGKGKYFVDARKWIFGEIGINYMSDQFSFIRICKDIGKDPDKVRARILNLVKDEGVRTWTRNYWKGYTRNNEYSMRKTAQAFSRSQFYPQARV